MTMRRVLGTHCHNTERGTPSGISAAAYLHVHCVLLLFSSTVALAYVSDEFVVLLCVVGLAMFCVWTALLAVVRFGVFVYVPLSIVIFEPVASIHPKRAVG